MNLNTPITVTYSMSQWRGTLDTLCTAERLPILNHFFIFTATLSIYFTICRYSYKTTMQDIEELHYVCFVAAIKYNIIIIMYY